MNNICHKAFVSTPLGRGQIISEHPKMITGLMHAGVDECHLVRFVVPHPEYGDQQWLPVWQIEPLNSPTKFGSGWMSAPAEFTRLDESQNKIETVYGASDAELLQAHTDGKCHALCPFCYSEGCKYYCPEHKYNPPENSGFAFCPQCESITERKTN